MTVAANLNALKNALIGSPSMYGESPPVLMFDQIYIRGANASSGTQLQVFFRTAADNTYSPDKSVTVTFPNGGAPVNIVVDMSGNHEWTGTITGLRIDLLIGDGWFNLESVQVGTSDQIYIFTDLIDPGPYRSWNVSDITGLWSTVSGVTGGWGGDATMVSQVYRDVEFATSGTATTVILPLAMVHLIDAIPPNGPSDLITLHRTALTRCVEFALPATALPSVFSDSTLNTPYENYQQAFFGQVPSSPLITALQSAFAGKIDLGSFAVQTLTEAIQQLVPGLQGILNGGNIQNALTASNNALQPLLAESYLLALTQGYAPTATLFSQISTADQQAAAMMLEIALLNGRFIGELIIAISAGDDGAVNAAWFLFNLCVLLKALGSDLPSINQVLNQLQVRGAQLPPQLVPPSSTSPPNPWWTGSYTQWFSPSLGGADVAADARATIMADLTTTAYPEGYPTSNWANGYADLFVQYSSYNWFYTPPPHGSCFAAATGVLMADGTVKAIAEVREGDLVESTAGPRRVAMVTTPPRHGRDLFTIPGIAAFFTASHPFRTADTVGPRRAAVDPALLAMFLPTSAIEGVRALTSGTALAARSIQPNTHSLVVNDLTKEAETPKHHNERLYDLILEGWESDPGAYFIGGPDQFLTAESEVPNLAADPHTTRAIVIALTHSAAAARQHLPEEPWEIAQAVAELMRGLAHDEFAAMLYRTHRSRAAVKPAASMGAIIDIFRHPQGGSDHRVGRLLENLLASHGRALRAAIALGWRSMSRHLAGNANTIVLSWHDLVFAENYSLPADTAVALRVQRIPPNGQHVQEFTVAIPNQPDNRYVIWMDSVKTLGIAAACEIAVLTIELIQNGRTVAAGRIAVPLTSGYHRIQTTLLSSEGTVVCHLGGDLRRISARQRDHEQLAEHQWNNERQSAFATRLGHELGRSMVGLMCRLPGYVSLPRFW